MADLLDAVVMQPKGEMLGSVIWLHGLCADGNDFVPVIPELGLLDLGLRVVLPHAPVRPVSINGGAACRAWYDITSTALSEEPDLAGIDASVQALRAWIAHEEEAGVSRQRLFLAGFSQGGVIALETLAALGAELGGVIALSTYLAREPEANGHSATPIFMGHGLYDPIVPPEFARRAVEILEELGHPVSFHEYPMPHAVSPEEISDLREWWRVRLA